MSDDRNRQYAALAARLRLAQLQEEPVSAEVMIARAAADIGNATALIACENDGKIRVVELPTAKAIIGLRLPSTLQKDDTIYQNGAGVPVALGLSALRYADEPTAARGHGDRYGAFTRDFALAGLALLGKAERIVIERLAVLLPEIHATASALEALSRLLVGEHPFTLSGRAQTIKIKRVVPTHEGAAAWHLLAARHTGNTVSFDGGGGTMNVSLGLRGRYLDTKTRDMGLQRVWDQLDTQLRSERDGRALTMLERYELERALVAKRPYHIMTHRGQQLRIDDRARSWFAPVAQLIASDAKSTVKGWRSAEALYYSGGQALHLASTMQEEFDGRLIVPTRPVEANVRGALAMLGASIEEAAHAAA